MTRRLRRLALSEVFGEGLLRRIDRLHGRRELHLTRLFKVCVLLVEIAVIRAHGIVLRRLDERGAADDEGKPRHCLYAFLCRCHAEVDIRLLHRKWQHRIRRSRIDDERRAVCMRKRTDLADGIQDARARLVVRRIDESDVGIFCERTLDRRKIGHVFDRRAKVDMGKSVCAADSNGTRRIRAVVYDEHLLSRRQKRIQAHVHIERT